MTGTQRTLLTEGQKEALQLLAELQGDVALEAQIAGVEEFSGSPTMAELRVDAGAPKSLLPDGPSPISIGVIDEGGELRGELFLWLAAGIVTTVEQTWYGVEPPAALPERADVMVHRYVPTGDGPVRETYFSPDQLSARQYSREQPRVTRQHRALIAAYAPAGDAPARVSLHACLQRLADGTATETWCVGVIDAWTDGPESFCVVYRQGVVPQSFGLRRVIQADPGDPVSGEPAVFGRAVADYDIGEPLGAVAARLRLVGGVQWWGDIDQVESGAIPNC